MSAQTLSITPALVDTSEPVETALRENEGRAVTTLEGMGSTLLLTYSASEPLEIFMVPLQEDDRFVPTDYVRFTLPQTEAGDVSIDLTVSPGWTPGMNRYLVNMFSGSEEADASFAKTEFLPAPLFSLPGIALKHLFTVEPYTPSSYHALRGNRIFGVPFAVVLGISSLIASGIVFFAVKPERRISAVAGTLTLFCLLYGLRFGIDLLRFSREHLSEYAKGQYDEAGSIYVVAESVRNIAKDGDSVYVCRDGTNFKEKLLRYFAYPTPIVSESEQASGATLALVMNKFDWSVDTTVDAGGSSQTLRCGPIRRKAERLKSFDDGAVLYKLL